MSAVERKLEKARTELQQVEEALQRTMGAQSYSMETGTDKRSASNVRYSDLVARKDKLEKAIEEYEEILDGYTSRAMRIGAKV